MDHDTINYRRWIQSKQVTSGELLQQLEAGHVRGLVTLHDRVVPVVSAAALDQDSYNSDNSDQVSSVSCRSASPDQQISAQEDNEDVSLPYPDRSLSPEIPEEEESSPGTGRNSPQATPNSAMSISPANSEVGSRLGNRTGSSSQTSSSSSLARNAPYAPAKARYTWGKNKKGCPDRADLDHDWRASASGPPSDKSSNSSGEGSVSGRRGDGASASSKSGNESRADQDTNWRDHINSLPPSGAKTKYKNKNQKNNDKGITSKQSIKCS